jgi:hypothetical protein
MLVKYLLELFKSTKSIYGIISFILLITSILFPLLIHKNLFKNDFTPWAIFASFIIANYSLFLRHNSKIGLKIDINNVKLRTTRWSNRLPAENSTVLSFIMDLKNTGMDSVKINKLDLLNLNLKNNIFVLENISTQFFVYGQKDSHYKKVQNLPFVIESKRFHIIECEIYYINILMLDPIDFAKKLREFNGCEFVLHFECQDIAGSRKSGELLFEKELSDYKKDVISEWKMAKRDDLIKAINL